jgi:hypothetical protein
MQWFSAVQAALPSKDAAAFQKATRTYGGAIRDFDAAITTIPFTGLARDDALTVARADGAFLGDVERAVAAPFAPQGTLSSQYQYDLQQTSIALAALNMDLGLPTPT